MRARERRRQKRKRGVLVVRFREAVGFYYFLARYFVLHNS